MKLVFLLFLLSSQGAFADEGLMGSAGAYTRGVGNASAANRRTADQLFQQALADEKTALSSFPPNIGLLAKAGAMAMDGIKADQQAQHFAKAAMNAVNTGNNSGEFATKNFGGLSEAQIKELATTSSPFRATAQSRVESYGMKVSEDGSSIALPLGMGSVSLNSGLDVIEKGMSTAAKILGYDPSDISKGLQQAAAQRDAIARASEAEAAAMLAASGAGGAGAGEASSASTAAVAPAADGVVAAQDLLPVPNAEGEVMLAAIGSADEVESRQLDLLQRENELNKYRDLLKIKMGIKDECPVGRADQNIFKMIHARYQILRVQDSFLETPSQVIASGH